MSLMINSTLNGIRILTVASLLVIAWRLTASAQTNTAELHGVLTDPSGNRVPGATISVQALDTGLARTFTTVDDGSYAFLGLRPGQYSVRISAAGFRPVLAKGITLTVGQKAELSSRLEISPVMEAVEVLSNTKLLEARRTSVSTTILERLIKSLPSEGRNALQFGLLDSAVTRENQSSLPPIPATGLNVDGQQMRANMVTIDGVDAIDNTINGVRVTIPQDAVQEFILFKSGYGAEFGRSSGAAINVVSKSGGSQFQGDVFGLLRTRHLSATNAFAGEPDPGDTNAQAGFTLGGPLKRGNTFFFTAFETTQSNSMGISTIGRDNYGLQEIVSPLSTGSLLVTPEQASFIRSAPAALAVPYATIANQASRTALYGNTAGGPTAFALTSNPLPASFKGLTSEVGNYRKAEDSYLHSTRIDRRLSDVHTLFARVGISSSDIRGRPSNSQTQIDAQNALSRTSNLSVRDLSITSQMTSTLGPTWLNELRFQFARRSLGLTTSGSSVAAEIPGVASIGAEPFAPADRVEKRWQLSDNISHVRASHSFKAGLDLNHIPAVASFPLNQAGLYAFPLAQGVDSPVIASILGPQFTSALKAAGAPAFSAVQLYGMGLPESFVQQFGGPDRAIADYRNTTLGGFFQDSWKPAINLMIQYGVRYDVEFMNRKRASTPLFQQAEDILDVVQSIPRDANNVAPRVGVSWDPLKTGKTVLRGSYGIYYGHPLTALNFLADVVDGANSPFLVASQLTGVEDLFQGKAFTPIGSILVSPSLGYKPDEQRYDPLSPVFLDANRALATSPILPTTLPIARNFRYTYSQQSTLGLEREIRNDWTISADYSFIRGTHIVRPRNINQGNFRLISSYERSRAVCPTLPGVTANGCSNPIYQGAGGDLAGLWDALGGNSPSSLAPLGQLIFNQFRPSGPNYAYANTVSAGRLPKAVLDQLAGAFGLPQASGNVFVPFFNVKQYESSASSDYHGLTLTLRKRLSGSHQLLGSWTWSHAIDDATDIQTFEEPQDNSNVRLDRGNSNFDQRHRFVLTGVFESPWNKLTSPVARNLLADWTFAPRLEVGSGRPYRLLTRTDRSLINSSSTARPSVVPLGTPGSFVSPDGQVGLALPELGSVGNLGRNVYTSPGYQALDFRLTRHFQLAESFKLNFIVDVFNAFNRVNINKVDSAYNLSGRPVSALNARQIQFGLKMLF